MDIARKRRKELEEKFFELEMHTLYRHYVGILALLQPSVFVMENVKGILSSTYKSRQPETDSDTAQRIFPQIVQDVSAPWDALCRDLRGNISFIEELAPENPLQYKIYPFVRYTKSNRNKGPDYLIRSELHGVPQERHRVILLGVREDIAVTPTPLEPITPTLPIAIKSVIGDLPALRSGRSGKSEARKFAQNRDDNPDSWSVAIRQSIERALPEITDEKLRKLIRAVTTRSKLRLTRGGAFLPGDFRPTEGGSLLERWLHDPRLGGVIQHETREHMDTDFGRYLFAAVYGRVMGTSPMLRHFPPSLLPDHKSVGSSSGQINNLRTFHDRFRVQVATKPATTITSHIRKDGHYFIHYDPFQCRSLTVREAARIQSFPDNYFFEGNRTEQYLQVGNAVPPLLAVQLASVVAKLIKDAQEEAINSEAA